MKKYVILLAVAVWSLLGYGQMNQVVWLNGRAVVAQSISQIDSLKYGEIEGGDTLHLVLPRVVVVHDTVVKTVYVNYCVEEDALKGGFSVAADKQVRFSKGNLRYVQSTKTWGFAEHQYDMIGLNNVTGGSVTQDATYGNSKSGTALADTIDLFGWSTDNTATPWGVSTSTTMSDYNGDFVDWGNNIGAGDTWRTLSNDEWIYLFHKRTNASKLVSLGTVNGVNGLILLPDDWTTPSGITFYSMADKGCTIDTASYTYTSYYAPNKDGFSYNTFTTSQWSQLETAGAVFFPVTGWRSGTSVSTTFYGTYWSSTAVENTSSKDNDDMPEGLGMQKQEESYMFQFGFYGITTSSPTDRNGRAVRLVQDL